MNSKKGNPDIRCRVDSCAHHCDEDACCQLRSITVEPSKNCGSGKCDESMCASYRSK